MVFVSDLRKSLRVLLNLGGVETIPTGAQICITFKHSVCHIYAHQIVADLARS